MSKCIVFDLDGTIIDSFPDIYESLNKALVQSGFEAISFEKFFAIAGYGPRNLIKDSVDGKIEPQKFEETVALYNDTYTNCGSPKTVLYDGMTEVLAELRRRGYTLCVRTNKAQVTTDGIANRLLNDKVDLVWGSIEGRAIKPFAESVLPILEMYGAKPEETFMVGDMKADIDTANNAGMKFIGCLWGYGKEADMRASGATVFAQKPADLLDLIK
ncbi:MAG: HAD family hydrolase [Clostridia bacterium]|nr:HAD family hydrolase [Clostridia bacterium]